MTGVKPLDGKQFRASKIREKRYFCNHFLARFSAFRFEPPPALAGAGAPLSEIDFCPALS